MNKIFSLLLIALTCAACTGQVTETGNTCPDAGCQTSNILGNKYTNAKYGVTISYPSGWTYTEASDKSSVLFEKDTKSADIEFSTITLSLLDYMEATYPEKSFTQYTTSTLQGYYSVSSESGPHGGTVTDYFFLGNDSTLVHVNSEVVTQTANSPTGSPISEPAAQSNGSDVADLLNGISIE